MNHLARGLAVLTFIVAACGGDESVLSEEPEGSSGATEDTSGRTGSQASSGSVSKSGASGSSGTPNQSGRSGGSAATGKSGATDTSGAAGKSGSTGKSGASGKSGATGSSGAGASGSGSSGASGTTSPAGTPVATHGKLSVKGGQMVDQSGKPVQLRGISSMWLNWEKSGYAQNLEGLKWLRDNWKLNLFRVATPLDVSGKLLPEDQRAAHRQTLETIIGNAIQLGIYVLVDLHSHAANDHLAEAVSFFGDISKKYGNNPNIIYETFNEPLKVSWTDTLKPYHEKLVSTIRANDPDNIIVLGTPNWSQDVEAAAASPLSGTNLMYTLHFYSCTHGDWLLKKANAARAKQLPMFVTEWGATDADGGVANKRVCGAEAPSGGKGLAADTWHEWMAQGSVSWAAWKFDDCTDASCLFKAGAPVSGGWTDQWLQGHGPYVRSKMLAP